MKIENLKEIASQRSAIGFDYGTTPNGEIDWYRLRYAWQDGTPMQIVESTPIATLSEPLPETIPTPALSLEIPLDLSESSPFLHRASAYTTNIPTEMKNASRWCVWQKHEDGRKIPYKVLDDHYWSKAERAKSDTPETWTSFDSALLCFLNANGHLDGLSFALGDKYCGFDFDNVIHEGKMHPQAKSWLIRLGGYSEVSQSYYGQKTILRGTLDTDFLGTAKTGRQFKGIPADGMATEVYHCRRFFFLTGNGSGEPTANQQEINAICKELAALKLSKTPAKPKQKPRQQTTPAVHLSDTALLEKIRASKQAEKFNQLWDGHTGAYNSQSEADLALTTILMWWCNNEPGQVERLFEKSGLAMREKWDREDYRERTLQKAVRSDGYTPRDRSQRQSKALQRLAKHRSLRSQEVTA